MMIDLLLTNPIAYALIVGAVALAVCLHELAHGLAAVSQGDRGPRWDGRLTLNPLVHMGWPSLLTLCLIGFCWGQAPFEPDEFRHGRWSRALVYAAGPLANLAVAVACWLLLRRAAMLDGANGLVVEMARLLGGINAILFAVNMLPLPPLDGFGIVSALCPPLARLAHPVSSLAVIAALTAGSIIGMDWLAAALARIGL